LYLLSFFVFFVLTFESSDMAMSSVGKASLFYHAVLYRVVWFIITIINISMPQLYVILKRQLISKRRKAFSCSW
jgi:hypothetical protein